MMKPKANTANTAKMAKRLLLKFYGMPLQIVVWFKPKRFQNSQQTVVT